MKQVFTKLSSTIIAALLLASCGQSSLSETDLAVVDLSAGHVVAVAAGDSLVPTSSDTRINVTHILEDGRKSVTILRGSAKLFRGKYATSP